MGSAKCSGSITDIYLVFWDHGTHISQWIKTAVKILIIYKWLTVTFIHIWNGLIWMLELTMDKMTYIEQWVTSSGRAKCLWRVQFVFPQTSFNFWLPSKRQSHNVLRVRFTMKVSTTFLLFFSSWTWNASWVEWPIKRKQKTLNRRSPCCLLCGIE